MTQLEPLFIHQLRSKGAHSSRSTKDELIRALFPYARINLNPGTLGSQPITGPDSAFEFYQNELAAYPLGQYQAGRNLLKETRSRAAQIWNQPVASTAITQGTTQSINNVATSLYPALCEKLSRNTIYVLTSRHEHYGATYGFENHPGYVVTYLSDAALFDLARFKDEVELVKPDVFLISHLTCDLGTELVAETMSAIVCAVDPEILSIVDIAQSLGIIPELPKVGQNGIDMVVGSCHKWMGGPPATGLTWMSSRLAALIKPYYCTAHTLDEDAPLGFLEASGGQDFAKLAALKAALDLYVWVTPQEVLTRSQTLAHFFCVEASNIFKSAGIQVEFFGAHGIITDPSNCMPSSFNGFAVLGFQDWDPYPLYDYLNGQKVHTKCVKNVSYFGHTYHVIRSGFPFYETKNRIIEALELIRGFLKDA